MEALNQFSDRLRGLGPEYLGLLDDDELDDIEGELHDRLDQRCQADPLYWGQNWTRTENPKWKEEGREWIANFPRKDYFTPLFQAFKTQQRLFVPKTREMMTSWSAMLWGTHQAQWEKAEVIVQADKEEKAFALIGYADCLYRNQPEFLKERHPAVSGLTELKYASGGRIFGIAHGEHKIRMYHPTVYIMDEAAFLPEAQQCYDAAEPVAGQIIAISSAGPGWFGEQVAR